MKNATRLLWCMLAMLAMLSVPASYGQDVSGMTGEVTDSSGAAVQGAQVTLTNSATGVKFTATTNNIGVYRFSDIPPAQGYEAVFTAPGFAAVDIKNIYLTVATIRTQNATLAVGAQGQAVEVTASNAEVTIDTSGATIGNTFDVDQLNSLPVYSRSDPTALFTLQPGVTDTGSVTGARVDQNNITLDGLDVNDIATGGAVQSNTGAGVSSGFAGTIVGHAPVDSIEEFRGTVGGLGATSTTASGGQFQLVTKSGTNQFHGAVNEYHRDTSLVANHWFNNNATPIVARPHLIHNQFGGNVGGPVLRDKLFFFFDFNESRIVNFGGVNRTVPLDTLRNGSIGYNKADGTVGYLSPTDIVNLDPAGVGASASWLASFTARFPHSNAGGGDGVNSGGFTFNAPNDNNSISYVGRGDYNLNQHMNLFGRITIYRQNSVETPNEFPGDPVTNPFVDRSYAFVVGHNWAIGNSMTNRVFLGETVEKFSFPNSFNPTGSTFFTFGDGADQALSSSLYLNPNSQGRRIPIPVVGDDFSWTKGRHTWQFGGTFKDILAHNTNVADFNTTEIGLGGFVLGLCGPIVTKTNPECGLDKSGNPNPSLRPADIDPNNTINYDEAFSFLLGRIANVQSDYNYNAAGTALAQLTGDQRYYRYYQTQVYAADSWKMTPSLTLTYGVTYQLFSVPYETHGLESTETLSFDKYFDARIAQSAASLTGPTAVPLISYVLGGKANHGPPLYQPEHHLFAPHVGFAFNPSWSKKTVFNGGIGLVYDRTIINAVQATQDVDSYLFQQTKPTPLGIQNDPYNSIRTDPRLGANLSISAVPLSPPPTPKPPYQPFVSNGIPNGLQNGLAFNATIDPTLKTPYSIAFNAGMQHQFPSDFVLKLSYSGRLGRRLLAQADANQIIDFPDTVSGQLLSQAFANITTQIRKDPDPTHLPTQPWFENVVIPGLGVSQGAANNTQFLGSAIGGLVKNGDFGDFVQAISSITPLNVGSAAQFSENTFYGNKGFSSYNALLLTLQKNFSHGLHFDFNYTWAHSIDNVSFFANSSGDTGIGGVGLVCDAIRPRECRANSDFDVKQYVTADATYQLPIGKNKMFLGSIPSWANEVVGGWSVSGITDWHTGQAWGTASNAFVASYSNDAPAIFVGADRSLIKTNVTKLPGGGVNIFKNALAASQSYEGPVGFQIGPRNSLRGPKFFNADLGLGKTFPIYSERVKMNFRADAFNALNHPNFALPAENAFNGYDQQDFLQGKNFGRLNFTSDPNDNLNDGARVLQLSLRAEF